MALAIRPPTRLDEARQGRIRRPNSGLQRRRLQLAQTSTGGAPSADWLAYTPTTASESEWIVTTEYLRALSKEGLVDSENAIEAEQVIDHLQQIGFMQQFANSSSTPEKGFLITCKRSPHHFEVELRPGCLTEWFYFDESSDLAFEHDGSVPEWLERVAILFR